MNVEKRLDPWMNLCHLYLAAVLKREVDEAREAKEQRRQESARLAQELRCVEERNRWKSVCLSRFRSARPEQRRLQSRGPDSRTCVLVYV